jgi:uncharacterized flavoprotein (TIGR03862 family)
MRTLAATGLMAAETLALQGAQVQVFDAMPSVGRKFLLAGIGGLNLTHSEPLPQFLPRYGQAQAHMAGWLNAFSPDLLRAWAAELGVETFVGSSGRVFPRDMKAAPLLRAWLHRLRQQGVRFHARHRWLGWNDSGALQFDSPSGAATVSPDATVLALGGASWPQLGSNGQWLAALAQRGVATVPWRSANCGFDMAAPWSPYLRDRFAGQPIKPVAASVRMADGSLLRQAGEFVLTDAGVEGSLIYALSAHLRDEIERNGTATLWLDLLPQHSAAQVLAALARGRGARSLATHLKTTLKLQGLKLALLHELLDEQTLAAPNALAQAIKAFPLVLATPRPVAEAISSAGGVAMAALDEGLMLRQMPGVFCAGEMLDWEAPTGGYLLTGCFASGRAAAVGAMQWWQRKWPTVATAIGPVAPGR